VNIWKPMAAGSNCELRHHRRARQPTDLTQGRTFVSNYPMFLPDLRFRLVLQRTACAWAVLGLCAACSSTPVAAPPAPPPPPPPRVTIYVPTPSPEDGAARQLLAYQATLSALPATDWPKEVARLSDPANTTTADAVKLALVLILVHGSGDLARAQSLLDRVQADESADAQAWHAPARLLSMLLAVQRRDEDSMDRLNQQLRDSQRKLDQLNDKLEALLSIERSLNNRAPAPALPVNPPAAPARPASRP
jgi:uncharacterized coiled-coil protein SlyX